MPGVPVSDAGAPVSSTASPSVDAGRASGSGVLCTACSANDECEKGALCIFRGGKPADGGVPVLKAGFCGHACDAATDCPTGFTCTQIGSLQQCLPNTGTCP
jgi:hypothetical protein